MTLHFSIPHACHDSERPTACRSFVLLRGFRLSVLRVVLCSACSGYAARTDRSTMRLPRTTLRRAFNQAIDTAATTVARCRRSFRAEPGDSRLSFPVGEKHRIYFLGYRVTVSLGASLQQGTTAAEPLFLQQVELTHCERNISCRFCRLQDVTTGARFFASDAKRSLRLRLTECFMAAISL